MEETEADDPFTIIGQILTFTCPKCGEEIDRSSQACEFCGEILETDDDTPLSLVAGEGGRKASVHKVPMEEAKNLLKLKQARDGVLNGSLTTEAYTEAVDDVLYIIESALELYQHPFMKHKLAAMEPAAAQIYTNMANATLEMHTGLHRMRSYADSKKQDDLDAGLKQVEAALWKVDASQEEALHKAEEA